MSFLNKKLQFIEKGTYQWWRIITYVVFGILLGSIVLSIIIVYNYTFRSLNDAHTIVLLNTNAVVNTVNMDNYNKATGMAGNKLTPSVFPTRLRNIFTYQPVASPTSTASSSHVGTPQ